ncbi:unnamed protein product [Urochloa humidicola]
MANPSYYTTSPSVRSQVQHQEHLFHLYAFQQMGNNEYNIVSAKSGLPNYFGCTNVTDWDIRDAPDTGAAVVARFQGVGIASRKSSLSFHYSFNVVFTDPRFMGSILSMQGLIGPADVGDEGDLAVVGGTGDFAYAQGICSFKRIQAISGGTITELRIRVVCLNFPKPIPVQKVGPWGGNGGKAYEIQDGELPQRLESVTIYANDFIQSIAFSYIDQTGQNRIVGPWGGDAGRSKHPPINFGPSETVKEIYGAIGKYKGSYTVVASLTIVTNVKTYGPYGKQTSGNTPFHIAAPSNNRIVGFYGSAGEVVDQIGAYVAPN